MDWIWWLIVPVVALGIVGFIVMEYLAYLERTQVITVNGGLRFIAKGLTVEMQRTKHRVLVITRKGHYTHNPSNGELPVIKVGELSAALHAVGLRIEVSVQPKGPCTVLFRGTAEHTTLRIEELSAKVAQEFDAFADQVRLWVDKVEQRQRQIALEEEEKRLAAEKAEAEKAAKKAPAPDLPPEVQIAQWRANAGFTGAFSEMGLDDKGRIAWFVDLDSMGHITLHANKRTVHTTLEGAEITSLGSEIELAVRDDFWSESEPELRRFRVLVNLPPDERRIWKERIEALINNTKAAKP
jgi:hypothetical protein